MEDPSVSVSSTSGRHFYAPCIDFYLKQLTLTFSFLLFNGHIVCVWKLFYHVSSFTVYLLLIKCPLCIDFIVFTFPKPKMAVLKYEIYPYPS